MDIITTECTTEDIMAKRFTDTDKWKKPWFNNLELKAKLAWIYILDECDSRGVWIANFGLMSFQCGFKITENDFTEWFGSKVKKFDDDKYYIRSFVDFQYGALSALNNAHKPILALFRKYPDLHNHAASSHDSFGYEENNQKIGVYLAPHEGPIGPLSGAQDKDKEKDKDKEEKNIVENVTASRKDAERLTPERVVEIWNENAGDVFGRVRGLNEKRIRLLKARIKEYPDPLDFVAAITWLKQDEFCSGKSGKWRADFDYLIRDGKMLAILEKAAIKKPADKTKADLDFEELGWV